MGVGCSSTKSDIFLGLSCVLANENDTFDVVFVHGWFGNKIKTWTDVKSQDSWISKVLPVHVKRSAIHLYGYPSKTMFSLLNEQTLTSYATNFIEHMHMSGIGENNRRVVYVCHGFGCSILKQALLMCSENKFPYWTKLYQQSRGAIFLGSNFTESNCMSLNIEVNAVQMEFETQKFSMAESGKEFFHFIEKTSAHYNAKVSDNCNTSFDVKESFDALPYPSEQTLLKIIQKIQHLTDNPESPSLSDDSKGEHQNVACPIPIFSKFNATPSTSAGSSPSTSITESDL